MKKFSSKMIILKFVILSFRGINQNIEAADQSCAEQVVAFGNIPLKWYSGEFASAANVFGNATGRVLAAPPGTAALVLHLKGFHFEFATYNGGILRWHSSSNIARFMRRPTSRSALKGSDIFDICLRPEDYAAWMRLLERVYIHTIEKLYPATRDLLMINKTEEETREEILNYFPAPAREAILFAFLSGAPNTPQPDFAAEVSRKMNILSAGGLERISAIIATYLASDQTFPRRNLPHIENRFYPLNFSASLITDSVKYLGISSLPSNVAAFPKPLPSP